jgi:hypothetical protein
MREFEPYTCRLLIRLDRAIFRITCRRRTYWDRDGKLCFDYGTHGVEARTHFPDWMFRTAAKIQNRYPWTRRVLSGEPRAATGGVMLRKAKLRFWLSVMDAALWLRTDRLWSYALVRASDATDWGE